MGPCLFAKCCEWSLQLVSSSRAPYTSLVAIAPVFFGEWPMYTDSEARPLMSESQSVTDTLVAVAGWGDLGCI